MNGKTSKAVLISFLLLVAGCGSHDRVQPRPQAAPIPHSARIQTADDAIAVVRRDIKRRGHDPDGAEYRARRFRTSWFVTGWSIVYPNNTGSSRFVPGGFTDYIVSDDGKIIKEIPGR